MSEKHPGVKAIQILAKTTYPIVSAYEFEFLKTETEVQSLLKPCTIYFIIQRPLTYINNLTTENGMISFDITDCSESEPLHCSFDPRENRFAKADEDLEIEMQFYKKVPDTTPPYNMIAGIKLYSEDGTFHIWLTPQKILHQYLAGKFIAKIDGDIWKYIDYKVHYIGKAFSQDIWNRLTGHHKLQSVLTREDSMDESNSKSSFEISLLMLNIVGYNESYICPYFGIGLSDGVVPIFHDVDFEEDSNSYEEFCRPTLAVDALELTNEVEANLVNLFRPEYNEIKFENYPNISSGTRSAGYSESTLFIEMFPAILSTDSHCQAVVLP